MRVYVLVSAKQNGVPVCSGVYTKLKRVEEVKRDLECYFTDREFIIKEEEVED